jgi:hypothetical protein
LNALLKASETQIKTLDIDALILENKFLQEKIENLEGELEHSKQLTGRYKVKWKSFCII